MNLEQMYAFCLADPVFFDVPQRIGDEAERWTPPQVGDATVVQDDADVWVRVFFGRPLPNQGWKIHVSADVPAAQEVLDRAAAVCTAHRVAFKYLRSGRLLSAFNSKYAHRGSSGKFIAVYPADEAELKTLLDDLTDALDGQQGPYILSDLRWSERSPVFLRYGAFAALWADDGGDAPVLAIVRPDGTPVADPRTAAFTPPRWAPMPGFVRERIERFSVISRVDLPYEIVRPLHFSNGGGVYLAKDTGTGDLVVLKEARPLAGLDARGLDAVARLRHEHRMLTALAGTGLVPRVLGYETHWEHDFLVQEYIDGDALAKAGVRRLPLVRPGATPQTYAEYTDWALAVLDKVAAAVAAVHRAGVVFGDLHPNNVIVRPDDTVTFIDLEAAHPIGEERTGLLGAPGFAAPAHVTGTDIDAYGLAALRLDQFIPLTALSSPDPAKPGQLARWAHELFPLPAGYAHEAAAAMAAIAGTTAPAPPGPGAVAGDWEENRAGLVAALTACATPGRDDRLFPNDPDGAREGGGTNLSNGAAGVLYALHATGQAVDPAWTDWLVAAALRDIDRAPVGLFNGACGVATVLDLLGRHEEATGILGRALDRAGGPTSLGLLTGLPGAGLTALGFHARRGDGGHLDQALRIADRVAQRLGAALDDPVGKDPGAGLTTGAAGAALFLVRLHERTGEPGWLDLAERALRRDLARCVDVEGSLQVDDGWRSVLYLGTGSTGIGLALAAFLEHRTGEGLAEALDSIRLAARGQFTVFPGLLDGRAGLLYFLTAAGHGAEDDAALQGHRRDVWRHAVPHGDGLAFPGRHLVRLSMDLATGSAGVLLAMDGAHRRTDHLLPLLGGPAPATAARSLPDRSRSGETPTAGRR
ncbi:serine/threonine protein kinase [Streptomyces lavendulae subsp. lavendulae]|uniref:class III lanthionine synthetase LanKC n=1 Tax=Streptomyces lavendulae TaxID=1914 RepID=UPI0024A280AB|nr:class III lanthionine synthetase LanKC [Streptomyces lavendulae]GLV87680.1 serine/threonine protein kinase [Streptomyces lavendulae subsp. lavendulae]